MLTCVQHYPNAGDSHMHFLVLAYDYTDPEAGARRVATRPAHSECLDSTIAKGHIISAAAVLDDAGVNVVGSMFVMEMPSRAELDAWVAQEPYNKGRVWKTIEVKQLRGLR